MELIYRMVVTIQDFSPSTAARPFIMSHPELFGQTFEKDGVQGLRHPTSQAV